MICSQGQEYIQSTLNLVLFINSPSPSSTCSASVLCVMGLGMGGREEGRVSKLKLTFAAEAYSLGSLGPQLGK